MFLIPLSAKLKFAIKVSLSIMLTYMIPITLGWDQPSTAAMTIMLIAAEGGVSNSIAKGMLRVSGTIIGAFIGMSLIAIFPQERMLFLISMSLVLLIVTYLYYAYQGDSTAIMLIGVMVMMIFLQGPENAFLYGIDRTYMTLFGILIYTIVGIFLWPVKEAKNTLNDAPRGRMFIWLDPEYIKATLQVFVIFWAGVAYWIYFNPPAGFMVVTLATLLGLVTTFSTIKPGILVILFTFGFIFATLSYLFILPNLVYGWQLALFIFIYSFAAFYLIKQQISIFFLLGMFVLNISNEMQYDFAIYLTTLLTFYMFLIILMLFYNFPFSARAEHLFTLMKERFIRHSKALEELQKSTDNSWLTKIRKEYHHEHLRITTDKMQIWGKKIDTKYFNKNSQELIMHFAKTCKEYFNKETSLNHCYNAMNDIDWNNLKMNRF
jgi:hypothetical protein